MQTKHIFLVGLLSLLGSLNATAGNHPKPLKISAEAQNETATPSLSRHMREAERIASFLTDALLLTTAQRHAVARCTADARRALVLAATDADAQQAQAQYVSALRNVLALSQLTAYEMLRQRMTGTTLPLDGTELAVR